MSDFEWDAPTATKPEPAAEASSAEGMEWDAPAATTSRPADPQGGLIPSMNAWVEFAWDAKLERHRPMVVDVSRMDAKEFGAWCERVRTAGGFATPVCLDASDAHDQSRALFVSHSYAPGYAHLQEAREQFAKLVEADWARELLRQSGDGLAGAINAARGGGG